MHISQVSSPEHGIHAPDCLKIPVFRPLSNAFANQCRGFPCASMYQISYAWHVGSCSRRQKLEAQSKKKTTSSCVTSVSLGYTSTHTKFLKC